VLTGLVERVTYQNAENGFCVLRVKARGERELVTLVGHAAAISAGEWVTASGNCAMSAHVVEPFIRVEGLRNRVGHSAPAHCS
jgi:hypothetical protein